MNEGEKVDRFCQGLKPQIRLEVMKAGAQNMNDASRIALNVDAALSGASMFSNQWRARTYAPTPMEIGNFEQFDKDRQNNACFRCHKVGCRPKRCGNGKPRYRRSVPRRRSAGFSNVNAYEVRSAGSKSEN